MLFYVVVSYALVVFGVLVPRVCVCVCVAHCSCVLLVCVRYVLGVCGCV